MKKEERAREREREILTQLPLTARSISINCEEGKENIGKSFKTKIQ